MKTWLLIAMLAGCSSKAAPKETLKPVEKPPASECESVAAHVATTVMAMKDPPKTDKTTIATVIRTHCEADAWSADAKKCLAVMTEATADDCGKLLTDDQNDKLMKDMLAHLPKEPGDVEGEDAGGMGSKPKGDSGDPCEGGE